MMTNQEYCAHKKSIPLFVPAAIYYELRDADLYPFPPRHDDTVSILCLWFKHQTEAGERSYGVSFSLNASGYRIMETFQTELENQVDAWLLSVREATPSKNGLITHGD